MPTVLKVNGFRFYFYASDRKEPKHVHVSKGDGIGKIWLEPRVSKQYFISFKSQEEKEILEIIHNNKTLLKKKWDEFFGK